MEKAAAIINRKFGTEFTGDKTFDIRGYMERRAQALNEVV